MINEQLPLPRHEQQIGSDNNLHGASRASLVWIVEHQTIL